MSKVASAVGLAALVAWLARKVGPEGFKNTAKKDPNKIQSKGTLGHPAAVAELGLETLSKKDTRGKMNPGHKNMVSGKMNRHQILV
jgi:hypothetical protein